MSIDGTSRHPFSRHTNGAEPNIRPIKRIGVSNGPNSEQIAAIINNIAFVAGIIGMVTVGIKTSLIIGVGAGLIIGVGTGAVLNYRQANPQVFASFEKTIWQMVRRAKSYIEKSISQAKQTVNQAKEAVNEHQATKKPSFFERFKKGVGSFAAKVEKKVDQAHNALNGVTQSLADEIDEAFN